MDFAASVNSRAVVLHDATSAAQVATWLIRRLRSVPDAPSAFVKLAAPQETSPADQVVAPFTEGVNDAAFACSEILSCLLALASTMLLTDRLAALAAVACGDVVDVERHAGGNGDPCLLAHGGRQGGGLARVGQGDSRPCADATVAVIAVRTASIELRTNAFFIGTLLVR